MSCLKPYPLYNKNGRLIGFSACGDCALCRLKRSQELCFYSACQAIDDYKHGFSPRFLTLTYTDMKLPISEVSHVPTTRFKDFQDYKKRVQIRFARERSLKRFNLKFLGTTEYGGLTQRPHLHCIVFGFPPTALAEDILIDSWQRQGEVDVGPLQAGGSYYLTSYCSSSPTRAVAAELYDGNSIERPHLSHSNSLGGSYLDGLVLSAMNHNMCVNLNGIPSPLPSYVRRKYDPLKVRFNKFQWLRERRIRLKNLGYTEEEWKDLQYRRYLNRARKDYTPVFDENQKAIYMPKISLDSVPKSLSECHSAKDLMLYHGVYLTEKIPNLEVS
ncbi:replication initiator protein [Peromfec virus RodF5_3]|uniref:Replication initiator protein n=1 Tax=Peromfec virus RodF5_3 TaxID=2929339 RepID=A0A976N2I4_9VIRU|nr:replication initiator protein [Peromfec virus RodF5_3]